MPLDENIDSGQDSKLAKVTHKKLKKKFCVSKEGKKRKDKEDNIRKKIKTCSLKNLKNNINKKLKKAGSKYILQICLNILLLILVEKQIMKS